MRFEERERSGCGASTGIHNFGGEDPAPLLSSGSCTTDATELERQDSRGRKEGTAPHAIDIDDHKARTGGTKEAIVGKEKGGSGLDCVRRRKT